MPSHGLKSDTKHEYQKRVNPFWDDKENAGLYSEATKQYFRERAAEFDRVKRRCQWEVKPQLLFRGEQIERMFESKLKRKI